jgi:hypothetical protein
MPVTKKSVKAVPTPSTARVHKHTLLYVYCLTLMHPHVQKPKTKKATVAKSAKVDTVAKKAAVADTPSSNTKVYML